MLRNIMMAVCMLVATGALAQGSKITEKQADAENDPKLPGAPMPTLFYVTLRDTSVKKDATAQAEKPGNGERHKARKDTEMPGGNHMQQRYLYNKDLDNGANLFVMMFNPTCSHCEDMTRLLEKNIALFKRSKVVLLANKGMQEYLPDFIRTLHIADYPPMYAGYDSTTFIGNVFLYSALPQINIYSGDRKLLKTFTGEVAIDSLRPYIQ